MAKRDNLTQFQACQLKQAICQKNNIFPPFISGYFTALYWTKYEMPL